MPRRGPKHRDVLLSAAIRLSDNPRDTQPFLEVADQVIDALQATHPAPIPIVEERTKEQRLAHVMRELEQLAEEYDETPFATRCARALEVLQQAALGERPR